MDTEVRFGDWRNDITRFPLLSTYTVKDFDLAPLACILICFDFVKLKQVAAKTIPVSVGIKEIAAALDVSIGTVDRALHGRPGINALTRARVLKMADSMGYRPNLAARFLKSKRQLRISVHLPSQIASFFDAVRSGITEAAGPFEPAVHAEFESYRRLGEGDAELLEQALQSGVNGIIIAPGEPAAIKSLIRKAARRNIPVVCVATDAPSTERLTAVSACPHTSGSMAGELICRVVRERGDVAVFTGSLTTEDHAEKLAGFRQSLRVFGKDALDVRFVIEAHDDEQEAFTECRKMLERSRNLRAVYVSTANSLPVLQAIEDSGRAKEISIITSDLFPELVPLIRQGKILATLHQRPLTQGRLAYQALYQFLIEGKCPPSKIRIAPHFVMRSNLDLFLEQTPEI